MFYLSVLEIVKIIKLGKSLFLYITNKIRYFKLGLIKIFVWNQKE
jgi:hypothetical protein